LNYGQLRASIEATLNRTDGCPALTTSFVDKGIRLIQRRARLPFMERTVEYTVGPVWAGLNIPGDFLEVLHLECSGSPRPLTPMPTLRAFRAVPPASLPSAYFRQRGSLLIAGAPAEGVELSLTYHADMAALADDADTNGLLTAMPDLVEWAALIFAAEHFEDPRGDRWNARYETTMADIEAQAERLVTLDQAMQPMADWSSMP